jgi:hypothetical protein
MTFTPGMRPQRQPKLGAGVVAGLAAGAVGACVWGGFTEITHLRIGYLSLGLGLLIGYAVTRAAGGRSPELGIVAALITLLACAAGDVGTIYIKAMHDFQLSFGDVVSARGPLGVLKDDLSGDKLGVFFYALAAFYASRYAARGGVSARGRRARSGAHPYGLYAQPHPQPDAVAYSVPPDLPYIPPQVGGSGGSDDLIRPERSGNRSTG